MNTTPPPMTIPLAEALTEHYARQLTAHHQEPQP